MSTSNSYTLTESFTITDARHIASKVATDLLRFQRFYGRPSNSKIDAYEEELVALLKQDYIDTVIYGFKRDGNWVAAATVRYRAQSGGILLVDDDPGKIRPGEDIIYAAFTSFLTYSSNWFSLSNQQQEQFEATLPFRRSTGQEPGIENGWWADDLTYSAGGRGLGRSTLRRW